jgi:hypothetical protein
MLNPEQLKKLREELALNGTEVGLWADSVPPRDQLNICIFSLSGRPLTMADILASLAHFTSANIERKVTGDDVFEWAPKLEELKKDRTPQTPPGKRRGIYWDVPTT